jgi:hypothetical protein
MDARDVMLTQSGAYSPEQLSSLQRIFDAIWLELESKASRHTFPWQAQAARYQIAGFLLAYANDRELDVEQIKHEILQRLASSESSAITWK